MAIKHGNKRCQNKIGNHQGEPIICNEASGHGDMCDHCQWSKPSFRRASAIIAANKTKKRRAS